MSTTLLAPPSPHETRSPFCDDLLLQINRQRAEGTLDRKGMVHELRALERERELIHHEVEFLMAALG